MHTERQARTKQCRIMHNGYMQFKQDNGLIETTPKMSYCIASYCMHWVFSREAPNRGRCGLNRHVIF